jgi:hypothetical protein
VGYKIAKVDTFDDKIVFTGGITHEDYVRHLGLDLTGVGANDRSIGQRTRRQDDHRLY